ncbi:membrane protein [Aureimonas endophytica]|uniref:Membrane protein n=1 Tax=Aureimonas endophytica TaxID=2027858 RepID=A0A916ZRI5_9HYPH|nr:OpgC domain-containing protein [Aureimonas endophytica]GGE07920.1 membrane protein [Aureimonas endophytica]
MAEGAGREERIDLIRGLCLLLIFAAHCNFSFSYALQQSRGFADASELFVMMAGMSAVLAYMPRDPRQGLPVRRILVRAFQIYRVHLALVAGLVALVLLPWPFGAGRFLIEDPGTLAAWQVESLRAAPLRFVADAALLVALPANLDILPLYVVLMGALPLLLALARRSVALLVAGSLALWLLAGATHADFVNRVQEGGHWHFDPLSWQWVLVLGLVLGLRLRRGLPPFPERPWLFRLAAAVALLSIPANFALQFTPAGLELQAREHALTALFVSKAFCGVLRLLDALAIVYLAWNLDIVRRACRAPWLEPVRAAGRHSLPVFACGLALSTVAQGVMAASAEVPLALQSALLILGTLVQLRLATRKEAARRERRRSAPRPPVSTSAAL